MFQYNKAFIFCTLALLAFVFMPKIALAKKIVLANQNLEAFLPGGDTTNAVLPDMVFWNLIDKSRKKAKGDFQKQKEILKDFLTKVEPQTVVMFNNKFLSLVDAANYDKLYVAANLIKDNCDEECFVEFRAYLISLGKLNFFKMVSEPDNLAELKINYNFYWGGMQNVAEEAYQEIAKQEIPITFKRTSSLSAMPKWSYNKELVQKYLPRLSAEVNK